MALPSDFNPFEHLQDTIRKVHNRLVREEFSDVGPDTWDPDISQPRGSLRVACTLQDNDTAEMIQMRYNLFYLDLRKAKDLQVPVYGIPLPDVQASRRFAPQITLKFKEDAADVDPDYSPVWGEISFRLMNETSSSITKSELTQIAQAIKREFGGGNGYIWKKGKKMFSYTDKSRGYQLQILARSLQDAKDLISKVLGIRNHTPDWKFLKTNATDEELEAYPYTPPNHTVMGKTQKQPRRRPNVDVRFVYAEASVWGLNKAIALYDKSFEFYDSLVT